MKTTVLCGGNSYVVNQILHFSSDYFGLRELMRNPFIYDYLYSLYRHCPHLMEASDHVSSNVENVFLFSSQVLSMKDGSRVEATRTV